MTVPNTALLGPIGYLTVHCAATPEGRDVKAAEINGWDIAKFGVISYHWIIELDGTAVRNLDERLEGAHVGGHNKGNVGVCYVGGLDHNLAPKDTRTIAQDKAIERLLLSYRARFPHIIIRGHRDWPNVNKACPCFDVKRTYNV